MIKKLQGYTSKYVKQAFDTLRLHLLGPSHFSKAITFSVKKFDPYTTLAANYLAANSINSGNPNDIDQEAVKKLQTMSSHYIDALEQKTLTDVNHIIDSNYRDIEIKAKIQGKSVEDVIASDAGQAILKNIRTELDSKKLKIDRAAELLVNNDLHTAQNVGALDGIIGISKALNIEDPNVFKLGVLDNLMCKHCKKLWHMDSDINTPKVYKLSELSGSPGDYKNPIPSIVCTHPNCRHVLCVIMPGFTFKNGKVTYIGDDHDEYEYQRK